MYVKLGNIKVNRTSSIDDFMIFAEVVDSKMSFEEPVIVRTPNELDIWFGRSFTGRDYLRDLLQSGVSLYLYKPVSLKSDFSNYIDINSYDIYEEEVIFYKRSDLPEIGELDKKYNLNGEYVVYLEGIGWVELARISDYVERPKDNYIPYTQPKYFATKDSLPDAGLPGVRYGVGHPDVSVTWYIWLHESWVDENELPQNIENESASLNNRDVLALTSVGVNGAPEYIYPEYDEESKSLRKPTKKYSDIAPEIIPDPDDVVSGKYTYALRVKMSGEALGKGYLRIDDLNYLNVLEKATLLYKDVDLEEIGKEYKKKTGKDLNKYYSTSRSIINFNNIYEGFFNKQYKLENIDSKEFLAYNTKAPLLYRNFNTIPNVSVAPDIKANYNILSEAFFDVADVFMWSKTIGTDIDPYDEEKNIKIKIEETGYLTYRFTITRYDYTEIYEGSLFPEPGEERIDSMISRYSKLIYCEIKEGTKGIRVGDFTLRGADCEDYDKDMYWKSLDLMTREEIFPDYILVPDINLYVDDISSGYDFYSEYLKFLDIAKELNCQVLIQNNIYPVRDVEDISKIQERNIIYRVVYEYWMLNDNNRLVKIDLEDLDGILSSKLYEVVEVESISNPEAGYIYKKPTEDYRYYLNERDRTGSQQLLTFLEIGSDYTFNYKGDKENRLIYFYDSMEVYGERRPGYFAYLYGLLTNIFSLSTTEILYNPPVNYAYDFPYEIKYLDNLPDIMKKDVVYVVDGKYYLNGAEITSEKTISAIKDNIKKESLEKFKSNYLVCNNQIYYYRDYKSGKDFDSTAWMRFAVSKIYREIQKNKWRYLSLKNLATIRRNILAVLNRITANFSLISSINLTMFNPKMENNFLELTIETNVADLVRENIVIDLIINYYED